MCVYVCVPHLFVSKKQEGRDTTRACESPNISTWPLAANLLPSFSFLCLCVCVCVHYYLTTTTLVVCVGGSVMLRPFSILPCFIILIILFFGFFF
jgi:hypothetical protein